MSVKETWEAVAHVLPEPSLFGLLANEYPAIWPPCKRALTLSCHLPTDLLFLLKSLEGAQFDRFLEAQFII